MAALVKKSNSIRNLELWLNITVSVKTNTCTIKIKTKSKCINKVLCGSTIPSHAVKNDIVFFLNVAEQNSIEEVLLGRSICNISGISFLIFPLKTPQKHIYVLVTH